MMPTLWDFYFFRDTSLTFDPKTCRAEGRSKLVLDFHLEFSWICRFGISYVQTTGSLVVGDLVAIRVLDWLAVLWPSGCDWLSSCYLGDQVQSLSFSYWFWWQLLGEIGRFTLNLGHKSCNQIRKVSCFISIDKLRRNFPICNIAHSWHDTFEEYLCTKFFDGIMVQQNRTCQLTDSIWSVL